MAGFKRPSNREQRGEFSDGKTDELLAECGAWKSRKRRLAWLANDHVPPGIIGSGRLVGNLSNGISDEIDDTNEREESAWRNGRDCSMTIMVFPRTFGTNGWIRRLLAAGRPTRRSRRVSQSVGRSGVCGLIRRVLPWLERAKSCQGWPPSMRATQLVSQLPSDYIIDVHTLYFKKLRCALVSRLERPR